MSRKDRVKRAGELYASGLSTNDIAPLLGVSKSTAALDVAASGVPIDRRARIRVKALGRPSARKGVKLTPEQCQAMSDVRKGKAVTTGTRRTPEQRERMREAQQRRWANHVKKVKPKRVLRPKQEMKPKRVALTLMEKLARQRTREACKRMLRRILTMTRRNKTATTEKMLGYTKAELRAHLEAQFRPGMCWTKRDSFHIDHNMPVAEFFRRGIFDPSIINALDNLQVLTSAENRAKGDSFS